MVKFSEKKSQVSIIFLNNLTLQNNCPKFHITLLVKMLGNDINEAVVIMKYLLER